MSPAGIGVQTLRPHRLYNAGDRITEAMTYSLPDGHDVHCIARWQLDAPEHDFFTVPQELIIAGARVQVNFIETLLRDDRLGRRGVIWVDANWEAPDDEQEAEMTPVAKTDKDAIVKGARRWKDYLLSVAQAHIDSCNQIRANGGVPLEAQGFTKRALREIGWVDPATAVLLAAQSNKAESDTVEQLKKQVEKLTAIVEGKEKSKEHAAR